MKNKSLLIVISTLLLTSCFNNASKPSASSNDKSDTSETTTSDVSSIESSEQDDPIVTIDIYSSNDIHGAILEDTNEGRCGIGKFATYFKEKGEQENTLLIDQGDTWQGSIYSNYNHGALITDVMNYIKFDARSVGNHDFDWGVDYIKANTAREYNGYSTPVLAGNVYDYNFATKEVGTNQQSDIGVKSVTYTLENGVKVGILGGIGMDQITSISSNYTTNITFTDHIKFIQYEAMHLRNDEKCDIIIASPKHLLKIATKVRFIMCKVMPTLFLLVTPH